MHSNLLLIAAIAINLAGCNPVPSDNLSDSKQSAESRDLVSEKDSIASETTYDRATLTHKLSLSGFPETYQQNLVDLNPRLAAFYAEALGARADQVELVVYYRHTDSDNSALNLAKTKKPKGKGVRTQTTRPSAFRAAPEVGLATPEAPSGVLNFMRRNMPSTGTVWGTTGTAGAVARVVSQMCETAGCLPAGTSASVGTVAACVQGTCTASAAIVNAALRYFDR